MLSSLIIMLREGIETALVIGLTVAYLERTGRSHLRRGVWTGLGLAVLGSVLAALMLQALPVDAEAVEGTLMLVAAVFVGTTMIWMHRVSRRLGSDIREGIDQVAAEGGGGAWALGAFIFFMVLREGAETVLLLSAISLSSAGLQVLLGAALGLGLAVAFGISFFKGSLQLDLRRFFLATTVILGVLVVELLLHAYHEYAEIGWVPATRTTMAVIGPLVNDPVPFAVGLLAFPVLVFLVPNRLVPNRRPPQAADDEPVDGPEARKVRADSLRRTGWGAAFLVAATAVVGLLLYEHFAMGHGLELDPATPMRAEAGIVRIPLDDLQSDTLHRFSVDVEGAPVRFIVYLDGRRPRVALDACEICGDTGYVQDGPAIICLNCGAEIFPATIGQVGGCHPIPLPFEEVRGEVLVPVGAIAAGRPPGR